MFIKLLPGPLLVLAGISIGLVMEPMANATTETFASLVNIAMSRMDRDMMVAPSGDVDRDFATMMIPHHQGAIDMAAAELRFGRDQILRRLAEGIVVEQQQEIVVMRQALAALPPAPANLPQADHPMGMSMHSQSMLSQSMRSSEKAN